MLSIGLYNILSDSLFPMKRLSNANLSRRSHGDLHQPIHWCPVKLSNLDDVSKRRLASRL